MNDVGKAYGSIKKAITFVAVANVLSILVSALPI
jgi:hypothetical protein